MPFKQMFFEQMTQNGKILGYIFKTTYRIFFYFNDKLLVCSRDSDGVLDGEDSVQNGLETNTIKLLSSREKTELSMQV